MKTKLNAGSHYFNSKVWPKPCTHAHNQLNLGNCSPESNHGQLFLPSFGLISMVELVRELSWQGGIQRTPIMTFSIPFFEIQDSGNVFCTVAKFKGLF